MTLPRSDRCTPETQPTVGLRKASASLTASCAKVLWAALPAGTKPDKTTVAAAVARCQIAIEDGDNPLVMKLLEQADYGPWTVVNGKDPAFTEGLLAENTLSLALRYFIQSENLDKAQQAMDRLEAVAGTGEEASAKLTAMYLTMGRDLQAQLDELGSGDKAGTPEALAKATAILGGFDGFNQILPTIRSAGL